MILKDGLIQMLVQFDADGPQVPEALVEAAAARARYVASLTGAALEQIGIRPTGADDNAIRLPAAFLLDLGAVAQLMVWEQSGISAHLDAGLPSASEATAQVVSGVSDGHYRVAASSTDTLSHRVFRLTLDEFAWDGLPILGVDVHLRAEDDERFIDMMAEFLWQNRHVQPESN